jgi:hypothetical protein
MGLGRYTARQQHERRRKAWQDLEWTQAGVCTGWVTTPSNARGTPILWLSLPSAPAPDQQSARSQHGLPPDRPAVGGGNDAVCPPTEQLGQSRVGPCDLGAVEFQPVDTPLVVTIGIKPLTPRLACGDTLATSTGLTGERRAIQGSGAIQMMGCGRELGGRVGSRLKPAEG